MEMLFSIDEIIASPCKAAILRVMTSRQGFKATGRQIALLAGFSAPSTHECLKYLHARNVLLLEVIGKQHIYALNEADRLVQKVIRPMFKAVSSIKEEIGSFIVKEMKREGVQKSVAAVFLYGSVQKGKAVTGSDVDVAVVVAKASNVESVSQALVLTIAPRFKSYFGAQLDPYVKSTDEFRGMLKKNQPPVSTLIKSYSVLYGKEPLEV
ncbi:MAG: nucleotidyltransferase domain-containing protein [Candidatus Omnitrophica bacterium]|nr:nucleotidyltransferase domain-containing protein [Candidatus Omnitrophota bacterium]